MDRRRSLNDDYLNNNRGRQRDRLTNWRFSSDRHHSQSTPPEHRNLSRLEDAANATRAYADLIMERFKITLSLRKYDQDIRSDAQQRRFLSQEQLNTFKDLVENFEKYNTHITDFNNVGHRNYLSDQQLQTIDRGNIVITQSFTQLETQLANYTYRILKREQNALTQAGTQLEQDATDYIQGDMRRGIEPNENLVHLYESLRHSYTIYDEHLRDFEDASLERYLEDNQIANLRIQDDSLADYRVSINSGIDEFLKQYRNSPNKKRK